MFYKRIVLHEKQEYKAPEKKSRSKSIAQNATGMILCLTGFEYIGKVEPSAQVNVMCKTPW
jgi:hypothetical protein